MLRELWGLFRPMLRWALIGILIFMFWQALPMDMLGMVIAGDLATYLEVAAAVWLVAQVTRVRWAAFYLRNRIRRSVRRARIRARRGARRAARLRPPSSDDGRPRPAFAFALA